MKHRQFWWPLAAVAVASLALATARTQAQAQPTPNAKNDLPNPYRTVEGWAKLPEGRTWGSTSSVDIDKDGMSVWVGERCGTNSCLDLDARSGAEVRLHRQAGQELRLGPGRSSRTASSSIATATSGSSMGRTTRRGRRAARRRTGRDPGAAADGPARRRRRRDTRSSSSALTARC